MTNNPVFDYGKLRGKIVEKFGTQSAFAKEIGMSDGTLSGKLANKSYFTVDEIARACNSLGIGYDRVSEYFFTIKV